MIKRNRQDDGKFAQKSEEHRHVRSIRLTDKTWNILGELAEERSITRADLIEEWVAKGAAQPRSLDRAVYQAEIESLRSQVAALQEENNLLVEEQTSDLESIRDRILKYVLKLGKQSPMHKQHSKALNAFIAELKSRKR